jgi:hypothetical protein
MSAMSLDRFACGATRTAPHCRTPSRCPQTRSGSVPAQALRGSAACIDIIGRIRGVLNAAHGAHAFHVSGVLKAPRLGARSSHSRGGSMPRPSDTGGVLPARHLARGASDDRGAVCNQRVACRKMNVAYGIERACYLLGPVTPARSLGRCAPIRQDFLRRCAPSPKRDGSPPSSD